MADEGGDAQLSVKAFRQIDPTMDTGADFAAEYQPLVEMQSKQTRREATTGHPFKAGGGSI